MCPFYGLIASEVTQVHRNCVCVRACACVRAYVRACVRACVCMFASGLAYVGLQGENCMCIIIIVYTKTYPATFVPTNPADSSHFVTPSFVFTLQKIGSKLHHITPYILHHPCTSPYRNATCH